MCSNSSALLCPSCALLAVWWSLRLVGRSFRVGKRWRISAPPRSHADRIQAPMPFTVGPGAISVAIALGSQRPKEVSDFAQLAVIAGVAITGLAAVAATIYVCYRFAEPTIAALGKHGTNVVVRLSAFLLLCIGIQIVWTGFSELPAPPAWSH